MMAGSRDGFNRLYMHTSLPLLFVALLLCFCVCGCEAHELQLDSQEDTFQWLLGGWGVCTQPCGGGGWQYRTLSCTRLDVNSDGSYTVVPEQLCEKALNGRPQKRQFRPCNRDPCPAEAEASQQSAATSSLSPNQQKIVKLAATLNSGDLSVSSKAPTSGKPSKWRKKGKGTAKLIKNRKRGGKATQKPSSSPASTASSAKPATSKWRKKGKGIAKKPKGNKGGKGKKGGKGNKKPKSSKWGKKGKGVAKRLKGKKGKKGKKSKKGKKGKKGQKGKKGKKGKKPLKLTTAQRRKLKRAEKKKLKEIEKKREAKKRAKKLRRLQENLYEAQQARLEREAAKKSSSNKSSSKKSSSKMSSSKKSFSKKSSANKSSAKKSSSSSSSSAKKSSANKLSSKKLSAKKSSSSSPSSSSTPSSAEPKPSAINSWLDGEEKTVSSSAVRIPSSARDYPVPASLGLHELNPDLRARATKKISVDMIHRKQVPLDNPAKWTTTNEKQIA